MKSSEAVWLDFATCKSSIQSPVEVPVSCQNNEPPRLGSPSDNLDDSKDSVDDSKDSVDDSIDNDDDSRDDFDDGNDMGHTGECQRPHTDSIAVSLLGWSEETGKK